MVRMRNATLAVFAVVGLLLVAIASVSGCGGSDLDGKLTGELFWEPDSWGDYARLPTEGYIRLADVTSLREIGESEWRFSEEPGRVIATGTLGIDNGEGRVSFTIPYDDARIDPDSDYAIIVRYSWFLSSAPLVGKGQIFSNVDGFGVSPPLVLTKGRPHREVEVELAVIRVIT